MTIDPHPQRAFALDVVSRLRQAGHQALWAGGCVRDELLGLVPKDYDVATDAEPARIVELFGRRRTLCIGAAFGVVAVVGPKPAGVVEVATFRRDADYSDGRRPDAVTFSTPAEDAQRRDFTINGLFFDPLAGQVIDYVGGVDDLNRRLLRAIGDPRARLREDKLRMLRAVRIATRFDCAIEPATLAAVTEMAASVTVVSPERIAQEMRGTLVLPERVRAVELLRQTGLLEPVLPELLPLVGAERWTRALRVLERLESPEFPLALAALLIDVGPGEVARRWRLSNDESTRVHWLIEHQHSLRGARQRRWSQLQPLLVAPGVGDLLKLHAALAHAQLLEPAAEALADVEFCRARLAAPATELHPPPLVTGDDLVRLGVPRGPIYARLLQRVRAAQLDAEIATHAEALVLVERLLAEA